MSDEKIRPAGVVYVLHFSRPMGARKVQHYIGHAHDVHERLVKHATGIGAKITRFLTQDMGATFELAGIRIGSQLTESQIKRRKKSLSCMCAVCQGVKEPQIPSLATLVRTGDFSPVS